MQIPAAAEAKGANRAALVTAMHTTVLTYAYLVSRAEPLHEVVGKKKHGSELLRGGFQAGGGIHMRRKVARVDFEV